MFLYGVVARQFARILKAQENAEAKKEGLQQCRFI
jgi:hypothetical protein